MKEEENIINNVGWQCAGSSEGFITCYHKDSKSEIVLLGRGHVLVLRDGFGCFSLEGKHKNRILNKRAINKKNNQQSNAFYMLYMLFIIMEESKKEEEGE